MREAARTGRLSFFAFLPMGGLNPVSSALSRANGIWRENPIPDMFRLTGRRSLLAQILLRPLPILLAVALLVTAPGINVIRPLGDVAMRGRRHDGTSGGPGLRENRQ